MATPTNPTLGRKLIRPFRRPGRYARGVRISIRDNATAYGYSILATTGFGLLQVLDGPPSRVDVFLYVLGAAGAFALLEATASRLFRTSLEDEKNERVLVLGSALSLFAVASGLAAALGVGVIAPGDIVWAASPAAATIVYLLAMGLQMGFAEGTEEQRDG